MPTPYTKNTRKILGVILVHYDIDMKMTLK